MWFNHQKKATKMSYSLNFLKGGYMGKYTGEYYSGLFRGILGVQTIAQLGCQQGSNH